MPVDPVDGLLRVVARAGGALRPAFVDAVARDGALSAAMSERALDLCLARYTPAALSTLRSDRLAGKRVRVVLAVSVATAPLRAIALPLLQGAAVRVKPSSRQGEVAAALVGAMREEGLDVSLDDGGRWDLVIAYGHDDTLDALRGALPEGVEFEGHGHGCGVGLVGRDADLDRAAEGFALDVALHDQRGCMSPQMFFVLGRRSRAAAFAERLHRSLVRVGAELPRGPVDLGLGSAVMQWQAVRAALGARTWRGDSHAVVLLGRAPRMDIATPGARNAPVVSVPSLAALRWALDGYSRWLSCVGVAGTVDLRVALPYARPRVCAPGEMQDPPLDGPEDPRPPMTRPMGSGSPSV